MNIKQKCIKCGKEYNMDRIVYECVCNGLLEGNTNIYKLKNLEQFTGSKNLLIKHEGENPTGSFKDRGMTVGISLAKYSGIKR